MLMLSSMKRENMHFHFVVRDGNEMYSVMHVQSCCFTNQRLLSRTTPLGSFFVFVFVCHLTLDIFLLFMLCVIVSEDIVSNFEAEQFGRLPFYGLGLAFSFLLGFRAIVMCACNFFLSENHLQPRGRPCASFRLSMLFEAKQYNDLPD